MSLHKITSLQAIDGYQLQIEFSDNTSGKVSLAHLAGKGVFSIWNQPGTFNKVYINQESGAISRNEQVDICPDSLYEQILASQKSLHANN